MLFVKRARSSTACSVAKIKSFLLTDGNKPSGRGEGDCRETAGGEDETNKRIACGKGSMAGEKGEGVAV